MALNIYQLQFVEHVDGWHLYPWDRRVELRSDRRRPSSPIWIPREAADALDGSLWVPTVLRRLSRLSPSQTGAGGAPEPLEGLRGVAVTDG